MIRVLTLLFCAATIISCKKNDGAVQTTAPLDSSLQHSILLTKDVEWRTHYQGHILHDSIIGYYFDSSYHTYTRVKSAGYQSTVAGRQYDVYKGSIRAYLGSSLSFSDTVELYLRMNATSDTIFSNCLVGNVLSYDMPLWEKKTLKVGDTIYTPGVLGGIISSIEDDTLAGVSFKIYRAQSKRTGNNYLVYSEGIGWASGLIPVNSTFQGNGGYLREMTFTYKNDSVHFSFDLP